MSTVNVAAVGNSFDVRIQTVAVPIESKVALLFTV